MRDSVSEYVPQGLGEWEPGAGIAIALLTSLRAYLGNAPDHLLLHHHGLILLFLEGCRLLGCLHQVV